MGMTKPSTTHLAGFQGQKPRLRLIDASCIPRKRPAKPAPTAPIEGPVRPWRAVREKISDDRSLAAVETTSCLWQCAFRWARETSTPPPPRPGPDRRPRDRPSSIPRRTVVTEEIQTGDGSWLRPPPVIAMSCGQLSPGRNRGTGQGPLCGSRQAESPYRNRGLDGWKQTTCSLGFVPANLSHRRRRSADRPHPCRAASIENDAANALAGMHQIEPLVDFVEA